MHARSIVALLMFVLTLMMFDCSSGASAAPSRRIAASAQNLRTAVNADVVVYGATPSGIAAAIEAAHLGEHVLLLEPGQHVGGMTTSGLGRTDLYNMRALGGLVQIFFETVHEIEGVSATEDGLGTLYEPHVAEQAFLQMLVRQRTLDVIYGASIASVAREGATIKSLLAGNGVSYTAKIFIDASYEGDLMAAAGVPYALGRESVRKYGESMAGVQSPVLPAGLRIDPYVVPGDPNSGLLPHIQPLVLGAYGDADSGLMGYSYRLCVSSDPHDQIPFRAPSHYDPQEFEALGRWLRAAENTSRPLGLERFFFLRALPNKKFDLNNSGDAFSALLSTDEVGANTRYVAGDSNARNQIAADHQRYVQGFLYFLTTDSRVPASIRNAVSAYGLCKDEFIDNGGWPRQLYVREARRMIGSYVMTQHDVERNTAIPDPIGFGGYNLDSHLVHRVAISGNTYNEGGNYVDVPVPYPISYRTLTPQVFELSNLLVSVAVSASHVAYESLRVEPTLMIMGQAAGAAAALAIKENVSVQHVNYVTLTNQLRRDGQVVECCYWAQAREWWHQIAGATHSFISKHVL